MEVSQHFILIDRVPRVAQPAALYKTGMGEQVGITLAISVRTIVVEVSYMEGFICKRKSYVDAGRVQDKICRYFA